MRVFISWSGEASCRIAELLRVWLPSVIQEVKPFVSSQDIAKGSRGLEIIGRELAETDFGIVVLTPDNLKSDWIHFEAGALSKSLAQGHVIPLLCGVSEIDFPKSPLRQFQWANFNEQEILSLLLSVNASCDQPLDGDRLAKAFEVWWPGLNNAYASLPKDEKLEKPKSGTINARVENALEAIMSDLSALRRDSSTHSQMIRNLTAHRNDRAPSLHLPIMAGSAARKKWAEAQNLWDGTDHRTAADKALAEAIEQFSETIRSPEKNDEGDRES